LGGDNLRAKLIGRSASLANPDKGPKGEAVDFGLLDSLLGFQLRRAQLRLFQDFKASLGHHGVTPGLTGLLVLIRENPDISQAALARAVNLERATMGEAVDTLVARGWVARKVKPTDKRAYALNLTRKGRDKLDALIPQIRAHEARLASDLTAPEQAILLDLLARFAG